MLMNSSSRDSQALIYKIKEASKHAFYEATIGEKWNVCGMAINA
jgi:hypothetical protein